MENNTQVKQLRYGTTVICNGKIGKIKSISNTDNVNVQLLKDNSIISIEKRALKIVPHGKNELIKYNNVYYVIGDISVDINLPIYHLEYVNSGKSKKKCCLKISSIDKNITSIDKQQQDKTIAYLKFIDRHNSTVNYLNKKTGKLFEKIDYKTIDIDMNTLLNRCKLRINQLDKICNTMKKCQDLNIQIKFIIINPFNFITQDFQLISYKKAETICNDYSLIIDFKIKLEKWTYNMFLMEKNTFYIPKWLYETEIKKFCSIRQENPINFKNFIKTIIIEKKINNEVFITTNYLLEIEKNMSDLMMELFDKDLYDVSDNEMNELINLYEEQTKKRLSNDTFSLEPEQKKSVINSIKNKFSIITGPPGTGKTEILKCINFVLYELYKKNKKSNQSDEEENIDGEEENIDGEEENIDGEEENISDDEELESINYDISEYNDTSEICIDCFDENKNKFVNPKTIGLMAPTGLAFINMQKNQLGKHYNKEISGTCHRLLYHTIPNIMRHKNPNYCDCEDKCKYNMELKMIQLDESSMLDTFVLYDLLKVCKYFNARLILLGDVEQLPSIGPGKVLNQLIESEVFSVTKLTKIKRQNSGALVNNILKMSKNIVQISDFIDDTMMLINIDKYIINKEINTDELENLINNFNLNKNNTKFITGFNTDKKIFNTTKINNLIQNRFNPENTDRDFDNIPSNNKYHNSFIFRVKDKIIRTENDYSSEKMRANGEEAQILNFDGTKVTIQYSGVEDKPEKIGIDELYENFILNYCVTVHKSQGSQYENVVFFIEPDQTFTDKKSIYTAISRAKTRCFVISRENDFINLQNNSKKIDFKVSLFMKESDNYEFPN